jgi:hypothetical protein
MIEKLRKANIPGRSKHFALRNVGGLEISSPAPTVARPIDITRPCENAELCSPVDTRNVRYGSEADLSSVPALSMRLNVAETRVIGFYGSLREFFAGYRVSKAGFALVFS